MAEISNKKVWVVRDPTDLSEPEDVEPYETTVGRLAELVVGTGIRRWYAENSAIYDNEREAMKDAQARWESGRRGPWMGRQADGSSYDRR